MCQAKDLKRRCIRRGVIRYPNLANACQCTLLICMTFYALQDLWEAWELQTAWRQTQCKVSIEILLLRSWKNNEEQVYSRQYAFTHLPAEVL